MTDRNKILELFDSQTENLSKQVNSGIEKYRKGNVQITLSDSDGNAVKNASVKIIQQAHHFRFGANIFMLGELETPEKNEKYEKYFQELFNMATVPFYWDALEPEKGRPRYDKNSPRVYRRPAPDLCLEFCEKHGIEPREHALAYDAFFPKWLYNSTVKEIKKELERHFYEISGRYADKIPTIEVTNEMEWEKGKTAFYDEPDFVEWCFKLAEKYFGNNELVINEHTGLAWEDRCRATDKYYAYTEAAMLKGARIDAIGMQYHLFNRRENEYQNTRKTLDPENLYRHLDLYSGLGKPLQITEITVPSYSWNPDDEEIQAKVLRLLYSLWFSHPAVEQIIYWNLTDGYAYVQDSNEAAIKASQGNMTVGENYYYGGLLRFDMSPKPAYLTLRDLIKKQWHTESESISDADGKANLRGFYGNYKAEIKVNGKVQTKDFSITKGKENNYNFTV